MQKNVHYSVDQLDTVIEMFKEMIGPGTIVTLTGLLGAGKTTFVQRLCRAFGVMQPVVSPTYSYVGIYSLENVTIYHFDLYRIGGAEEFEALGFADYLEDPRGIVLIEWPEHIITLLNRRAYAGRALSITVKYVPENAELRELAWALPQNSKE